MKRIAEFALVLIGLLIGIVGALMVRDGEFRD